MRTITIAIAAAIFFASAAYAKPIYLDCILLYKSDRTPFSVKLDEASGKITHTKDDGSAFNTEGFFASNTISYQYATFSNDNAISRTFKYEIDRTSLKVKRDFVLESVQFPDDISPSGFESEGFCRVVEVADRKI